MAFAVVLGLCGSAAGAADVPRRIVPSYQGAVYDRLSIPAAASRPRNARTLSGRVADGPRYEIVCLGNCRASPYATRVPVAITRQGRILLVDYRLGPQGAIAGNAAVVLDADGTAIRLQSACPACDPTPLSRGTFHAFALSDAGDVVGSWNDYLRGGPLQGSADAAYDLTYFVRWSRYGSPRPSVAELGFGTRDAAYAINDLDVAVGQDGPFATKFNKDGHAVDLGTLKGTSCDAQATAIDDASTVAGFACARDSSVAVTFPATGPALPLSSLVPSAAEATNAAGAIAGFAQRYAVVWKSGKTTYLPPPPGFAGANAVAYGLNDANEVVGDVYDGSRVAGSFLFARGRTYFLDALLPPRSGWRILHVTGINDAGDIIGVGVYRSLLQPFVLRPLSISGIASPARR